MTLMNDQKRTDGQERNCEKEMWGDRWTNYLKSSTDEHREDKDKDEQMNISKLTK
jgi:hypothetical protein